MQLYATLLFSLNFNSTPFMTE